MKNNSAVDSKVKTRRASLYLSLAAFTLYMGNILIGKINIHFGLKIYHLGIVTEFLLLLLTSVLLIVAALQREASLEHGSHAPIIKGGKA